jgi:hypothetical protein
VWADLVRDHLLLVGLQFGMFVANVSISRTSWREEGQLGLLQLSMRT